MLRVSTDTQNVKLLGALEATGLSAGKARSAARLLTGVEYGPDDEPTNLGGALTAATAIWGEMLFTPDTLHPVTDDASAGVMPVERRTALEGVRNVDDWKALQDSGSTAA